jgi:sulfonate dioxygenase
MAPALIETTVVANQQHSDKLAEEIYKKDKLQSSESKEAFAQGVATTKYDVELKGDGAHAPAAYPHYLPYWEDTKFPPYEPFEAIEHGKDADPTFPNLLAGGSVKDLTANIGAEVS